LVDLPALRALTRLPAHDVVTALGLDEADVVRNVAYQNLRPLDRADGPQGIHVFLHSGRVAVVYASEPAGISAAQLEQEAGADQPLVLRSRAGPQAELVVHPGVGLAWSHEGEFVHFVEAFPPMSAEQYRRELYNEPVFLL
jgi:hypothetical protein